MQNQQALKDHVLYMLRGRGAHMSFDEAVAQFPPDLINVKPGNLPYSFWHLVEHMRIAQWDILEFMQNPRHVSPEWPAAYWPDRAAETDAAGWERSIIAFRHDLQALQDLVADPHTDLLAIIPHTGEPYTVLREALLVADHNAYHIGEFAILRHLANAWPT